MRAPQEADWNFAQAEGGLYLVSRQLQKNGSITEYRVTCPTARPGAAARSGGVIHLVASSQIKSAPAGRAADVGKSVHGAKLHPSGRRGEIDLGDVQVSQDRLNVAGDLDRSAFQRMLGERGGELYIDLDVSAEVASYVGGATHRFPLKNLGEAMPVLYRNCA